MAATSTWEQLAVGQLRMPAFVSLPEGGGPADGGGPLPALVVIHHAPGVDGFIQGFAERLAAEGYAAIAPDLFHRITEAEAAAAEARGQTRRDLLSDPDIVADVDAAAAFLQAHPQVDAGRIGITGFCMGGRVAWLGAATNPIFRAAAPFYGGNIMVPWGAGARPPVELAANIRCPVLFHFGEEDPNPSPDDMRRLDAELTRHGVEHRFFCYPGANHAFMNHEMPARYHRTSAEMAWARTREFLAEKL